MLKCWLFYSKQNECVIRLIDYFRNLYMWSLMSMMIVEFNSNLL